MSMPTFFLLACLCLLPTQAEAHKIHVFAWVAGDTVTVESNFSGDKPLINGKVTVKNKESDTILLEGIGDKKGIFTFTVPSELKTEKPDLLIVVSGGEGHQSEWLIPATEYLTASTPPSQPFTSKANTKELQKMIRDTITQELAPIKRTLAENRQSKPGFRDIMGGIGYLLGFAGLIAWMRNRQPTKDSKTDA